MIRAQVTPPPGHSAFSLTQQPWPVGHQKHEMMERNSSVAKAFADWTLGAPLCGLVSHGEYKSNY